MVALKGNQTNDPQSSRWPGSDIKALLRRISNKDSNHMGRKPHWHPRQRDSRQKGNIRELPRPDSRLSTDRHARRGSDDLQGNTERGQKPGRVRAIQVKLGPTGLPACTWLNHMGRSDRSSCPHYKPPTWGWSPHHLPLPQIPEHEKKPRHRYGRRGKTRGRAGAQPRHTFIICSENSPGELGTRFSSDLSCIVVSVVWGFFF